MSTLPMIFGHRGERGTQWTVPWSYTASTCNCHPWIRQSCAKIIDCACYSATAGSICTATVNISESAEKETMKWADIWAAAVAVDASKSRSLLIYLLPKG